MSEKMQLLQNDMKDAMRAKDKVRLNTIRMTIAEVKRYAIDHQAEIDDDIVMSCVKKAIKQRQDAEKQYRDAGRDELAEQEATEREVLAAYMPAQLSEGEVTDIIARVVREIGATSMRDMGQVMAGVKAAVNDRADMGKVSGLVKNALQAL